MVAHDRIQGVLAAPTRVLPPSPTPFPEGPLDVMLADVGFRYEATTPCSKG